MITLSRFHCSCFKWLKWPICKNIKNQKVKKLKCVRFDLTTIIKLFFIPILALCWQQNYGFKLPIQFNHRSDSVKTKVKPMGFSLSFYEDYVFFVWFVFCHFTPFGSLYFLNFQMEPELGAEIDPDMVFTPLLSSILDEARLKPTTFRSWVKFANH